MEKKREGVGAGRAIALECDGSRVSVCAALLHRGTPPLLNGFSCRATTLLDERRGVDYDQ
jgi:hypothetical protein